jgi:hypothetical protein
MDLVEENKNNSILFSKALNKKYKFEKDFLFPLVSGMLLQPKRKAVSSRGLGAGFHDWD